MKRIMKIASSFFLMILTVLVFSNSAYCQTLTQTIRGSVMDAESGERLIGAYASIVGSENTLSGITDVNGDFFIENVPVGRISIRFGYVGYEDYVVSEILVSSAKEVYLKANLRESIEKLEEVVVKAKKDNIRPNNNAAVISARSFSVEETKRFPASISDPSRMALSFAGVTTSDDETNEIVIRGNAPNMLHWRIEGIEVPNPNHFQEQGFSTGAVSILNVNMLDRSDFLTGAFPAEYGNALSGVFDIKLRNGNARKKEYAFQFGVMGTDLTAEGPIKEGYNGSYLINYRYSTLGILDKVIDFGEDFGAPIFQDLSFKVNLPVGNNSVFSMWGIGGLSQSNSRDTQSDTLRYKDLFSSDTYMGGATFLHFFKDKSRIEAKVSLSGNASDYTYTEDDLITGESIKESDILSNNSKRISLNYLKKLNTKTTFKTGVIGSLIDYSLESKETEFDIESVYVNGKGDANMLQGFIQAKHRFSEDLSSVVGVHATHFSLNNKTAIEPRLGIEYRLNPKHTLTAGIGLHSRILPLNQYFVQEYDMEGNERFPNQELDFTRAAHFVLGYDWRLIKNGHLKFEAYYQNLSKVGTPINQEFTGSIVNGGYLDAALSSDGKARNYGLEMTLEKFFSNQYYYLLTTSIYDSKYRASNNKWYNSEYNFNYTFSLVGGKEFTVGKEDNNIIGTNLKVLSNGGKRGTPFDFDYFEETGEVRRIQEERNTLQFKDYLRADLSIYYQLNRAKVSHVISLDFQNVTNAQNVYTRFLDRETGEIRTVYQLGLIPILNYKIEF